ncbi:MAG: hypothetical protein Q8M98_04175 [Candidatus Cloacimonadaceae bacterium]|nr:hypothetical protein [Candidatus Cloacimonadaceae bacterium]MDP3113955.1 hypothetical protein [Candidatus Cloacimonadaceae bacterium]
MNKRWLIILLLISASFNLAVLGSYIYFRSIRPCPMDMRGPHPGHPAPEFHRGEGHWRFMGDDSIKVLREEFGCTKKQLMDELAKDPINTEDINRIIETSLAAQIRLEREMGKRLIKMRNEMSAEEAQEFFSKRREEMQRRRNDQQNKYRRENSCKKY